MHNILLISVVHICKILHTRVAGSGAARLHKVDSMIKVIHGITESEGFCVLSEHGQVAPDLNQHNDLYQCVQADDE